MKVLTRAIGKRGRGDEAGKATPDQGAYAFTGHQVALKHSNGATKTLDTFGTDEKPNACILGIDGNTFHNAQ